MMAFLMENLATIVISAVLIGVVTLVIVKLRKDKKAGKGCASCSGCPHASSCKSS